jgi:hypothetical protein
MSISASPPETPAPSAGVLADRNAWLLGLLGLATGLPTGFTWYNLFPALDVDIETAVFLSLTALGVIGLLQIIAGPFLDRYKAPFFRTLGHRRAWLASSLAAAMALTATYAVAAALAPWSAAALGGLLGIAAVPVMALLWLSLDALRIELRPGRAQAAAFGAQFIGALAAGLISALMAAGTIHSPMAFVCIVLLAVGLGAVLVIDEPAPLDGSPAPAPGLLATLARPWSAFLMRHGASAKFVLAAIAFYALGASIADYLGQQGYVVDIIGSGGIEGAEELAAARRAFTSLELAFMLMGAAAGTLVAGRFAPPRAFAVLQYAVLALTLAFAFCKLALGFTALTVAGLFAARTILFAFGVVIFAVVAARLTARPYTAGQFALLGVFVTLFWLSHAGLNRFAPALGGLTVSAIAAVAAVLAMACMRLAARVARRGD